MIKLANVGGQLIPLEDVEPGGGSRMPPEVIKVLEEQSMNGIIVSGIFAWIRMNNHEAATDIWKKIAEQSWSNEEITEARSAIKAAASEKLVELVPSMSRSRVDRGLESKRKKEMQDIIDSVIKLEEAKIMPLVLACSGQMAGCPAARGSLDTRTTDTPEGLVSRMMTMEETMVKFIDNTTSQLGNLQTEMKKCTEVKTKMAALKMQEENLNLNTHEEEITVNDEVVVSVPSYLRAALAGNQENTPFIPVKRNRQSSQQSGGASAAPEGERSKQRGRNVFHGSSRSAGADGD